jgi:hypothetical protein
MTGGLPPIGSFWQQAPCRVRILCYDMCLLNRYLAADNFFWLHYSGLSAAMSQYNES